MKSACDEGRFDNADQLGEAGEAPDALVESEIPEYDDRKDGVERDEFVPCKQILLEYAWDLAVVSEPESQKKCHINYYGII